MSSALRLAGTNLGLTTRICPDACFVELRRRNNMRSVALILLVVAFSDADAQRRCTKGIPCGNSCISAGKTCRVGTGTAVAAPREPPRAAPPRADSISPVRLQPERLVPPDTGPSIAAITSKTLAAALGPLKAAGAFVPVRIYGLQKNERWMEQGELLEVQADHLIVIAQNSRLRIPFTSIQILYTSLDVVDKTLSIILRP